MFTKLFTVEIIPRITYFQRATVPTCIISVTSITFALCVLLKKLAFCMRCKINWVCYNSCVVTCIVVDLIWYIFESSMFFRVSLLHDITSKSFRKQRCHKWYICNILIPSYVQLAHFGQDHGLLQKSPASYRDLYQHSNSTNVVFIKYFIFTSEP